MKTIQTILIFSILSLSSIVQAAEVFKVTNSELPRSVEVVDQLQYKSMPSYPVSGASDKLWLCAHAAFATAMNVLRTKSADAKNQLEYFHVKLTDKYPTQYANNSTNPHREAHGSHIEAIINGRSDFKAFKKTTMDRNTAKQYLQNELKNEAKQQLVVLTKSHGFGHFVVLYEINKDLSKPGGGTVKFADPYGAKASASMTYTDFLNGMRDAGSSGRYSFWVVQQK